jgi:hypothetical protein
MPNEQPTQLIDSIEPQPSPSRQAATFPHPQQEVLFWDICGVIFYNVGLKS